jgi:multidrug efflux pump subunit AcrA (membrane-fusion protein)
MSQQQGGSPQIGGPSPLLNLPGMGGDPNDPALLGGPSTPWWRQRRTIIIAAIILLLILLGAILLPLLNRKQPVNYNVQNPQNGNLDISVSATGPLQSSVYNLIFFNTGSGSAVIQELDVKVGQKVTKGQILAKLDKTALQDTFNQQQQVVTNDQNALFEAEQSLATTQNLANQQNTQAQTTTNGSQNNQNAAQNTSQSTIDADQTALDNAQTALDQARTSANATKAQAQAQLNSDLAACNATPTPSTSSSSSTTSSSSTSNTSSTSKTTPTTGTTATATSNSSIGTSSSAFTNTTVPLTVLDTNSLFKFDSTCTALAQAKFNATVAQANSSVQTAQATVDTDQAKLNTDRATANQTNVSNQGTVNNNKASQNTQQASGANTIQSQTANVVTAQNNLKSAQLLLQQDQHNLDNATLKAPHDGTVTTINGTVGSAPGTPPNASQASTTTSSSTFIQLVDTATLQVVANVNETDTANLKVGEPVQFTVNAYGDRTFKGTVSQISPNGQTVSNVVTYPVYIDVDPNSAKGANLFPGMTANVTIIVLQRNGVLLIPVDAINFARLASGSGATAANAAGGGVTQLIDRQSANAAMAQARQMRTTLMGERDLTADNPLPSFVIVRTGTGQYAAKPVVLGLTDGTNYEVLDGLTTQDNVVVGIAGNRAGGATGTSTTNGG